MILDQPSKPRCINCKLNFARPNGKSKLGFQKWQKYCDDCAKAIYSQKHKHLLNKKTQCDQCGFIASDKCQLDLVYKDGNSKNKNIDNLLTLCANCSRLHKKSSKLEKKSILSVTVDNGDIRI
jgi:uncharacterized Zn finger protein